MAARLLIDGDEQHPFRSFTDAPWQYGDFMSDLILAVTIRERRVLKVSELIEAGMSDDEARAGQYHEAYWEIDLPSRWVGQISGTWESTAFGDG
jgi:hypothetical protein